MDEYRTLILCPYQIEVCRSALLTFLNLIKPCPDGLYLCKDVEELLEGVFCPWDEDPEDDE